MGSFLIIAGMFTFAYGVEVQVCCHLRLAWPYLLGGAVLALIGTFIVARKSAEKE